MANYIVTVKIKRTNMSTNSREVVEYYTDSLSDLLSWFSTNLTDPYEYDIEMA